LEVAKIGSDSKSELPEAVLRKWQECCKLGVILRTERNGIHGYLPTVQMASVQAEIILLIARWYLNNLIKQDHRFIK